MLSRIKQKLIAFGRWCKRQWKKIVVIVIGGTIVLAAGSPVDVSFENLPNVAKEQGKYKITYNQWSEVEIPEEDIPSAKLKKWGDETFIKISYPDFQSVSPKQDKGKLKWKNGKKEVHLYSLEPREFEGFKQLEQGGFEFEIIYKSKPATNKIVLNIETEGLKFYYQPLLNLNSHPEADHCTETICYNKNNELIVWRPENVVGSYAVLHNTQDKLWKTEEEGEKYKAGMFGMIYRPKIIDSNNWEVWGELNISNGKLTIAIPQSFLDNAVYPVIVDPTFGFETKGASRSAPSADYTSFAVGTPTDGDGTADSISFYCELQDGDLDYMKGCLWLKSDLSLQDNGVTDIGTVQQNEDWLVMNFSTPPSITDATDYYVGTIAQYTGRSYIWFTAGSTGDGGWDLNNYGTPANMTAPLGNNTNMYSAFCTYTPEAPPVDTFLTFSQSATTYRSASSSLKIKGVGSTTTIKMVAASGTQITLTAYLRTEDYPTTGRVQPGIGLDGLGMNASSSMTTTSNDVWEQVIVNATPTSDGVATIKIWGEATSSSGYLYIDDMTATQSGISIDTGQFYYWVDADTPAEYVYAMANVGTMDTGEFAYWESASMPARYVFAMSEAAAEEEVPRRRGQTISLLDLWKR